jgi:hypothetical protein
VELDAFVGCYVCMDKYGYATFGLLVVEVCPSLMLSYGFLLDL